MKIFAILSTALLSLSAVAATPYKTESIMLLQPDSVLKERVESTKSFADYIKASQAAVETTLASETPSPTSGFIVFAVRPGSESRVWFDFKPELPAETTNRLRTAIQSVATVPVKGGTVVFALRATLWGAPSAQGVPNPSEWSDAMKGRSEPMEVGDLVDKLVWPTEAGT
jgi:hypothetical protein